MNIAHYPGDQTAFDPDHYVGADSAGAFYQPTAATYDAENNRTAIQYRPIPRIAEHPPAEDMQRQMRDRMRIMGLFGGHW